MENGSEVTIPPRMLRILNALQDEVKAIPIGYRRPLQLVNEALIELYELTTQKPNA